MSDVLTAETNREEWLAARRKGIGASEIAAVLGISPWQSPFSLYWAKVNGWDYEPSAEMEWGTRLESAIAIKYANNHPDVDVWGSELVQGDPPWMLATPDRVLRMYVDGRLMPPHAVVELKTAHSADGWGEPGTDEVPVYYRAQVLWQLAVLDVAWGDIAVLIGGSDYREYTVLRDAKDIAVMVEAGRRFMRRIETGDPPPIDDHQATLATIKRLHPDLEDETVRVTQTVADGYVRAVQMRRLAENVQRKYEALLRAEMGNARRAESDKGHVATRVITEVAGYQVGAHTKDYLLPPRERKTKP